MTTPTPPDWLTCNHRDARKPGCPNCDMRLDPETVRERFAVAEYVGALTAKLADTARALGEAQRTIEMFKEPVGVGPWTRVGGPMPEPWVGCGVEQYGVKLLVTRVAPGHGAVEWEMDAHGRIDIPSTTVTSLWDNRVCVWKRE